MATDWDSRVERGTFVQLDSLDLREEIDSSASANVINMPTEQCGAGNINAMVGTSDKDGVSISAVE